MTLRVALGSFVMSLQAEGLGDDQVGKDIAAGYLRCSGEMFKLMHLHYGDGGKT